MAAGIIEQITALHQKGLSPAEIAEALSTKDNPLTPQTVEFELARQGAITDEDIPEEDFRIIRERLLEIAKYSSDEPLSAKVGMFLWEQKRGSAKLKQAPPLNLTQINQLILDANKRVLTMYANPRPDTAAEQLRHENAVSPASAGDVGRDRPIDAPSKDSVPFEGAGGSDS